MGEDVRGAEMSKLREAAQAVMATESLPAMVLAMARLRDALVEDGKLLEAAVLAEREACAKAAEGYADFQLQLGDDLAQWRAIGALAVMAAISERGQE
jgi:hypothetical protein